MGGAFDTMIEKLLLLMLLACPVMMGVMMLLMWRGMRGHHRAKETPSSTPRRASSRALRAPRHPR
jgi:hypothetical protein